MNTKKIKEMTRTSQMVHDETVLSWNPSRGRELCGECLEFLEDHAQTKCLYGATSFRNATPQELREAVTRVYLGDFYDVYPAVKKFNEGLLFDYQKLAGDHEERVRRSFMLRR